MCLVFLSWQPVELCFAAHVFCVFVLKGRRTLSLLVENWGRVNYGKTLDEQRKGMNKFNSVSGSLS